MLHPLPSLLIFTLWSIHLIFFLKPLQSNIGSCVGPQDKIGHVVRRIRQLTQVSILNFGRNVNRLQNMCSCVSTLAFWYCEYNISREIGVFYEIWSVFCCVDFFVKYVTELCVWERERDREREGGGLGFMIWDRSKFVYSLGIFLRGWPGSSTNYLTVILKSWTNPKIKSKYDVISDL